VQRVLAARVVGDHRDHRAAHGGLVGAPAAHGEGEHVVHRDRPRGGRRRIARVGLRLAVRDGRGERRRDEQRKATQGERGGAMAHGVPRLTLQRRGRGETHHGRGEHGRGGRSPVSSMRARSTVECEARGRCWGLGAGATGSGG
jgi:hypothetical protein